MKVGKTWLSLGDEDIDSSFSGEFARGPLTWIADSNGFESPVDEFPSTLHPRERLVAALTTSAINGSERHVRELRRRLDAQGVPSWLTEALTRSPAWPVVDDDRLAVIVMFAAALTTNPGTMNEEGIVRLRRADLTDADVLDLANVVAYYNYANRLALALGVR